MKRFAIMMVFGTILTAALMACGASQGANCDAYGSVDNTQETIENNDLAQR